MADTEFPDLTEEAKARWDRLAEWWDDQLGEGNSFQDMLIEPAQDRLLAVRPGESILDVACGAGRYTRRLCAQGASVVAVDASERFLARARARTPPDHKISYRRMDVADVAATSTLGESAFDAAVCTMALMDIAELEPVFALVQSCLRSTGRFVVSIPHPCFQSPAARLLRSPEGEIQLVLSRYMTSGPFCAVGVRGQPEPTVYFHRPLGAFAAVAFRHNFVINGLLEPAFPVSASSDPPRWRNSPEFSPVLVVRFQRLARNGTTSKTASTPPAHVL